MLQRLLKSDLHGPALHAELDSIIAKIRSRCSPDAIVLFGSAGRDRLTGASDIDLLLLFPEDDVAEQARKRVLSPGPLSEWPVDVLFIGRESFREKCKQGGVYQVILREGRLLYPADFQWGVL